MRKSRLSIRAAIGTMVFVVGVNVTGQIVCAPNEQDLPQGVASSLWKKIQILSQDSEQVIFPLQATITSLGWRSFQLACYLAGRLEERGYRVSLACRATLYWVVVHFHIQGSEVGVPVVVEGLSEASSGSSSIRARVPLRQQEGMWFFEERYCGWDSLEPIPRNEKPRAYFVADEAVQLGKALRFVATQSYDRDGVILFFFWNYGDGSSSEGMITEHTYHHVGRFTVTLTVVDDRGASSSVSKIVMVYRAVPTETRQPGCGCTH